ncbi:actin-binding Rho-activating protein-like [Ambystoma mexicanum]|uniref:actin-binding Rho-activating protein-like n=1 Tax=Ambystoma mexicanum TaxID=8296 RepID=UPI0037E9777B
MPERDHPQREMPKSVTHWAGEAQDHPHRDRVNNDEQLGCETQDHLHRDRASNESSQADGCLPSHDPCVGDTSQATNPQVQRGVIDQKSLDLTETQGWPLPVKLKSNSNTEHRGAKHDGSTCHAEGNSTEGGDGPFPSSRDPQEEAALRRKTLLAKVKVASMADIRNVWQRRSEEHLEQQRRNPFSDDFDHAHSMSVRLRKGDKGYGRPTEGSATERRGLRANRHVRKEMEELCLIIRDMGVRGRDGRLRVTFGRLFEHYVRVSDKVVGILLRARKHGMLDFEGEMLWQGVHDHILITLLD